jgi:thymidylate synthase
MKMSKNIENEYLNLLKDILENGIEKKDRTGTGTISVFGRQIRHDMSKGFPLLTTKRMYWKGIVTELLWFLRGDTNIKYLVDNDCHIWNGDAYRNYCEQQARKLIQGCTYQEFVEKIKTDDEFAKKWGDLGPIYGKQWVDWGSRALYDDGNPNPKRTPGINQIQNLIEQLKTNPDSRRLMVSAWNVADLDQMTLPPCHYGFQVYTRELTLEERQDLYEEKYMFTETEKTINDKYNVPTRAISLMWNQRSVDTFLGLPFNIASYGLLLEIIAKQVNMVPDELIGTLGDCHLYKNHIDQAKEQIGRRYTLEERIDLIPEGVLSKESIEFFNLNKRTNNEITTALAKYRIRPNLHTREPFQLPLLRMNPIFLTNLEHKGLDAAINDQVNFELENYESHPIIKAPLNN